MNDGLAHGRLFFMEIKKDGIALYEADDTDLHTPRPKTPAQALEAARECFEDHYPGAIVWPNTSRDLAKQKRPKEAAFLLNQATEHLYADLLLTLTYYTPYNHNSLPPIARRRPRSAPLRHLA